MIYNKSTKRSTDKKNYDLEEEQSRDNTSGCKGRLCSDKVNFPSLPLTFRKYNPVRLKLLYLLKATLL